MLKNHKKIRQNICQKIRQKTHQKFRQKKSLKNRQKYHENIVKKIQLIKFVRKIVKKTKNIGHNILQGTSKNVKVHISVNNPHFVPE